MQIKFPVIKFHNPPYAVCLEVCCYHPWNPLSKNLACLPLNNKLWSQPLQACDIFLVYYCTKRRPLSTLLKSYRVKTMLLGKRKTILLKWIIAVSFKFWFHCLHVLFLVTKSASLKMKVSCYRTKNILSFSREAVFSQQLPTR